MMNQDKKPARGRPKGSKNKKTLDGELNPDVTNLLTPGGRARANAAEKKVQGG
jgi:hypothetical protein